MSKLRSIDATTENYSEAVSSVQNKILKKGGGVAYVVLYEGVPREFQAY